MDVKFRISWGEDKAEGWDYYCKLGSEIGV